MKLQAEKEISRIIQILSKSQLHNGSWDYPFETGIKTDAFMVVLLRALDLKDEELIRSICGRIASKQGDNGAWKLFDDQGEGDLSLTIEGYFALLSGGYYSIRHPAMLLARRFITKHGGVKKAGLFTKILLALTGAYQWPPVFPLPIEAILLPSKFPVSLFDFSIFGRANMVPILILGNKKFQLKGHEMPDLSEIRGQDAMDDWSIQEEYRTAEWRSLLGLLQRGVASLAGIPAQLRQLSYQKAEQYMLKRMEPDGTFYSYFSATFLMIFALLSLGYGKDHPVIRQAVNGLKDMSCLIGGKTHMQYTTANVWNTALISHALQEAGVPIENSTVKSANHYLLSRQHVKYGDWKIHNALAEPGGWGFSDINTLNPDVDDTTAALRSLAGGISDSGFGEAWKRGANWVLSMQNDDGGWPAFERKADSKIVRMLPVKGAEFILSDASSADLTGRTLDFLGSGTDISHRDPVMERGLRWLVKNQRKDGSWYGRWGICYIYGTWAALTGFAGSGQKSHPSALKGASWLKEIQNKDGGWGESCQSDIMKTYVPLNRSTVTQTAWAVDALISMRSETSPEIENGVHFLISAAQNPDWTASYPKGQGMAGNFYIHYHSYDLIFSLLALSHYVKLTS
ncbi:squalene--hopene cyclase [Metabacillus sp. GX 13764]|uniref:terpene cyclase/mutase family protein n=1 Tax=Metabacillus kandeliae TaxID=2900151 RepID=UPI001E642DC0|nr:prenyltransferase/squalene oxidase repeat-containing protein [Metabacillus kandeliae]MCD7033981.1 squalene--hopene cyclase [Metabacillus kandeliae]